VAWSTGRDAGAPHVRAITRAEAPQGSRLMRRGSI
jgi:hypothetical protein